MYKEFPGDNFQQTGGRKIINTTSSSQNASKSVQVYIVG